MPELRCWQLTSAALPAAADRGTAWYSASPALLVALGLPAFAAYLLSPRGVKTRFACVAVCTTNQCKLGAVKQAIEAFPAAARPET